MDVSKNSGAPKWMVYNEKPKMRSKLPILGMVIPPLIGNPYNGYINPYYWVDDHPHPSVTLEDQSRY